MELQELLNEHERLNKKKEQEIKQEVSRFWDNVLKDLTQKSQSLSLTMKQDIENLQESHKKARNWLMLTIFLSLVIGISLALTSSLLSSKIAQKSQELLKMNQMLKSSLVLDASTLGTGEPYVILNENIVQAKLKTGETIYYLPVK